MSKKVTTLAQSSNSNNTLEVQVSVKMSKKTTILAQSSNSNNTSEVKEIDESSLGWKIFAAFVNDKELSATEEELIEYAVKEHNVDISKLPPDVIEILPLVLVAYMNMWSGWHFKSEFLAGKFRREHYFNRFQKFMGHKMRVVHNGQISKILSELSESQSKNTNTPSGKNSNNNFSSFAISIQCPPHMLNTIAFANSDDDVILKQHLGNKWTDLSTIQLVNWPHVEVTFRTQNLCFVRRQATEFVRYLNIQPHECRKLNDNVIERAETHCGSTQQRECYAYRFLELYIKEYIHVLKLQNMQEDKLEEIQVILNQLLEDVKYINVNRSIATNTVVLFRLSRSPFIRNKKLVKNSDKVTEEARVGYCEIVTPKVELLMTHFKVEQIPGPEIKFEFTERLKKMVIDNNQDRENILPHISYKCTFCQVEYTVGNTKNMIMEHLKNEHGMEQHVRCTICKKQFDVMNLAACRWRHKCATSK